MSGVLHGVLVSGYGGVEPPEFIGQAWAGGFYAGDISYTADGVRTHRLVVAPFASGRTDGLVYKTSNTATTGTDSEFDGWANSNNMNNASHPAAQFCRGLDINGYDDWYLPALAELEICYFNLKPASTTTEPNTTTQGINVYAVPARGSNYTTTNPAQTASGIGFRVDEAEAWDADFEAYWSSTSASDALAVSKAFRRSFVPEDGTARVAGSESPQLKDSLTDLSTIVFAATRAIRRVAG